MGKLALPIQHPRATVVTLPDPRTPFECKEYAALLLLSRLFESVLIPALPCHVAIVAVTGWCKGRWFKQRMTVRGNAMNSMEIMQ